MGKFFWFVLPVLIALSLVYVPSIWVYTAMIIDFYTPWVLFESPLYDKYHEFLVSRLTEKPEIPLPEITAAEATYERLKKESHGFSFPIVIRGLLGNTTGVQQWGSHDWWIKNYGDEEMLCGTLAEVVENCTVGAFFDAIKHGRPFYISGASEIVERHPELHEMIDNEAIRNVEPGRRTATQIFMGLPQMGSDIHCAIGINIFRMVAGQKKWWFIPPSETVYLKPAINVNGFSCHTHTKVGKEGEAPSPWLSKLVRYTTVLNPGDILFNPPWYWHGILNLGDRARGDLVIGSPSRYGGKGVENRRADGTPAALKTNWLFTVHAFFTLWRRYGNAVFRPDFKMRLQADIANNRRDREHKALVGEDPDVTPDLD